MVRRERWEKLAFARLLAGLLGPASRMSLEAVESMLGAYERRVTHQVYTQPPRSRKTPKQREQEALLAKVDKLTVSDEDMPMVPPPKKPGGRRRR
jgi:hypothetical protein